MQIEEGHAVRREATTEHAREHAPQRRLASFLHVSLACHSSLIQLRLN